MIRIAQERQLEAEKRIAEIIKWQSMTPEEQYDYRMKLKKEWDAIHNPDKKKFEKPKKDFVAKKINYDNDEEYFAAMRCDEVLD